MAISRAEIQRRYRDRKKAKEGKKYLEKETKRVKKYYEETTDLNPCKLEQRRERTNNCMRRKRQEEKEAAKRYSNSQQNQELNSQEQTDKQNTPVSDETLLQKEFGPCDSTNSVDFMCPSTSHESVSSPLTVKMKFNNKRQKRQEGKSYGLAQKKIEALEPKINKLAHKNDALRKKLSRQAQQKFFSTKKGVLKNSNASISRKGRQKRKSSDESTASPKNGSTSSARRQKCTRNDKDLTILTPKSRSKEDLRMEGLSPSKYPKIIKKLSFHNCLVNDLNERIKETRGRRRERSAVQSISGKLIKKYRMKSCLRKEVKVSHRSTYTEASKKPKLKYMERKALTSKIVSFLEREDNSCLPGKRDALKCKSEKLQVRVLSDYLYNLHTKFRSEFPDIKISLTTFSSCRQKNVKLVHFSSRKTCLCQKHQNMALKIKVLKQLNITTTNRPDIAKYPYFDRLTVNFYHTKYRL